MRGYRDFFRNLLSGQFWERFEDVGNSITPQFTERYARELQMVENIRLFQWLGFSSWQEFEALPLEVYMAAVNLRRMDNAKR